MKGITDSMEWISEEQEKRLEAQGKRLLAITRNDVVAWREFIERQEMHGLCRMFEGLEIMEDGMVDFEKEKEEFEREGDHIQAKTGWIASEKVERTALELSGRLDGLEFMKVPSRAGYLEELNDFWMEKAHFTIGQERFQVVWEYVAEMARLWDCRQRRGKPPKDQRHPDCFQKLVIDRNETNVYLQRRRSPTRTNRYYDANTYLRQGKPGEYEVWEFGKGLQNTGKGTKKAKNLNNVLFRGCRPDN